MTCSELVGKTVLVVDDEPQMLFVIKRMLEAFNCQVLTAQSGLEALGLYNQHRTDIALVLVDMRMPDISGLDFARTLRLHHSRVPIVVVSGVADKSRLADNIEEVDISAWLNKPFTPIDFEQMINDVFCAGETMP